MDFARVRLNDDDAAFQQEVRTTLADLVTDDVQRRNRATGDNLDIDVHLALGAKGWLAGEVQPQSEGGFTPIRQRIYELETYRARMPYFHWSITKMVVQQVQRFASPSLKEEVLPGVLSGKVRLCLGYTEPEGGSDVATCKTRAIRDGDSWIINGAKMFTTGAHNSQYVFLVTNTDPSAPKHRSLTMFLVPLSTPGIEIQGLRTVDGDRTNIVYYSDVCVSDRYRIGEVNGGWTVLRAALDEEHKFDVGDADQVGLRSVAGMAEHIEPAAGAIERLAAAAPNKDTGRRPIDNEVVKYRLGRSFAQIEAALSTPDHFGRVAVGYTLRDVSTDLMDVSGVAGTLPVDTDGAPCDGTAEHLYRLAGPTGIYGGTLEVYLNMIAEHSLGLGKPSYARPSA
ncbi:acyl-CoA dehydrogenase family protein [Mycobacterium intracellulare]|uniref:acyl-CoA dehydrogenase family protein n=1 Tax=Mycobacterium intracellulare TaxID=1767 RepID=UPI001EED035D|nr:acyl-CoA dehydrogenase family protein [Mycobacterium intracellulare]MEE3751434.1 acyl-CoA dehydrogenase family protein [Mycobacterium intracellulare]